MRTFTAIVNPSAGGSSAAARLLDVARVVREGDASMAVEYSRTLDHAKDLARTAVARGDVVVAVGGDGITGGLAHAVAEAGGVLGIVPAGRGNDFARQLGLPTEATQAAAVLLKGEERAVDLIATGDTLVAGSVYAGFDSLANEYANRSRLIRGGAAYVVGGMRAIATWRPVSYRVVVDGQEYGERGYTVIVANSGFYGGGIHIVPQARVDDGLLDVVVIRHGPKRLFFTVLREAREGAHIHRPEFLALRGREVRVEADRDIPAYADGEPLTILPLTASVRPAALKVLRPAT